MGPSWASHFLAALAVAASVSAAASADLPLPQDEHDTSSSSVPGERFVLEHGRRLGHLAPSSVASLMNSKDREFVHSVTLLREHLLKDYSPLRPPPNARATVQLYLTQLVKVDTEKQTWTIGGWWRMAWKDTRLSWEENKWNVSFLSFAEGDIWRPDDTVHEAIQDLKSRDTPTMITVGPDGSASLSEPRVTTMSCRMRLASFPFDTQICSFTVGSGSFGKRSCDRLNLLSYRTPADILPCLYLSVLQTDRTQLDIVPRKIADPASWWREGENSTDHQESAVDMVDFLPNTEFTIPQITITRRLKKFACCENEFTVLQFEFQLQRSSLTYFTGTIVPLIAIVLVSLMGLFLGARSFGRIYLGIVSILATTSIYRVASSQIPKSGEWTLIGKLYVYGFVNGLTVIMCGMLVTSLALIFQLDQLSEAHLKEIFTRYDMSMSGSLDADEVREALHELGLNHEEITKCLMRLPFNQDGVLTIKDWLALPQLLTFDSHGDKAIARHHNSLTGALLDWGLKKDRERTHTIAWERETIADDLALLTSYDHALLAMKAFAQLHVAGNYQELKRTREIMKCTDHHERSILVQKAKLDQKLSIIARRLQLLTDKLISKKGGGIEAGTSLGSEVKDIDLMRQCIEKVLRGPFAPPRETAQAASRATISVVMPAAPELENLPQMDAETLETFLVGISGELADRAKFKKYAPQIRKLNIDGSTLRNFDEEHIMALENVALGDRRPLLLGIRLLYRFYEASEQYMYQLEVRVMSASHLPKMDHVGAVDAYVHVFLDDHKRGLRQDFTSSACRDNLNPSWLNQYGVFRVADLTDPGEMSIRLFDWDRFCVSSEHELIGSHLFGEALLSCAVTTLRNCEGDVLWLSELLCKLKDEHEAAGQGAHPHGGGGRRPEVTLQKEVVLPLYHLGQPVIGEDGKAATVTLAFRLPQGTKSAIRVRLKRHEYLDAKVAVIYSQRPQKNGHGAAAGPSVSSIAPDPTYVQNSNPLHADDSDHYEKYLNPKSEVMVERGNIRSEVCVQVRTRARAIEISFASPEGHVWSDPVRSIAHECRILVASTLSSILSCCPPVCLASDDGQGQPDPRGSQARRDTGWQGNLSRTRNALDDDSQEYCLRSWLQKSTQSRAFFCPFSLSPTSAWRLCVLMC